jgi:hypothetical protein
MDIDTFRKVYADVEVDMEVWHNVYGTHGTVHSIHGTEITVEWPGKEFEMFDLAYVDEYMILSFASQY